MDNRIKFEEIAKSIGLPNPSDEQIQKIIEIYERRTIGVLTDNEIIDLYKQVQIEINGILDQINDDYDKDYYNQYFKTYPMLYFSIIPRHVIKSRLNNRSDILQNIFLSIPNPINIQYPSYSYLHDDMETYHKIYVILEKETDHSNLYKFILSPIQFLESFRSELNTNSLVKTLKVLTAQVQS